MQRFATNSILALPKICALLLAFSVGSKSFVNAQATPLAPAAATAPSATPAAAPADPLELGRETPRGTVIGFIRAAQAENYDVAVQYFEARRSSVEREQELAQQLLAILNARFVGSLDSITNDATGRQNGEPPREQVVVGGTRGLSESFTLYLVRVDVSRGAKVWLISRQTLDQVPEVYDSLRFPQLEKRLPKTAFLLRLCSRRIRGALGMGVQSSKPLRRWGPGVVLGAVIIHYYFVYLIGASILYRQYYRYLLLILLAMAFYWATTRFTYWISVRMWDQLTSRGRYAERSLVSLTRRVIDVAIFVVIGLFVLSKLDANVPAALAGLGIGGLAIGLGAQKTLKT